MSIPTLSPIKRAPFSVRIARPMRLSSKLADIAMTSATAAQITPRLTRRLSAESTPRLSGGILPMPLKPRSSGSVPNNEKKLMPHATETSARKWPDSRAVTSPRSQAIAPVSSRPAARPTIGGAPANLVSNVVA